MEVDDRPARRPFLKRFHPAFQERFLAGPLFSFWRYSMTGREGVQTVYEVAPYRKIGENDSRNK